MRPVGLPEHHIQQNLHHQLYKIQHPQVELTAMTPLDFSSVESAAIPPSYIRWTIPQLCVAASLGLVLYGITSIGDGWIFSPTVGYHALGMTIACIVCTQQRVLYVAPYVKPSTSTYIYYGSKIIGILCGSVGMVTIVYLCGIHIKSFHACSGVAFGVSWLLQLTSRLLGWTRCALCAEHITYGIGLCSALMGLQYGTFKNSLLVNNSTLVNDTYTALVNSTVNTATAYTWSSWLSQTSVTSLVLLASGITTFIAISFS
jgi:hypothetical protein